MGNIKMDTIEGRLEKIYTPEPLVKHLIGLLKEYYKEPITEFLEPASGSGNIIDVLKKEYADIPIIAYDIFNESKREDIIESNFLKIKIPYKKGRVAIMNPPFSNAIKFIYKCLECSDLVISIMSMNSWANIDYKKYNVDIIELIKSQPFSDGKGYDISIIVIKNK